MTKLSHLFFVTSFICIVGAESLEAERYNEAFPIITEGGRWDYASDDKASHSGSRPFSDKEQRINKTKQNRGKRRIKRMRRMVRDLIKQELDKYQPKEQEDVSSGRKKEKRFKIG